MTKCGSIACREFVIQAVVAHEGQLPVRRVFDQELGLPPMDHSSELPEITITSGNGRDESRVPHCVAVPRVVVTRVEDKLDKEPQEEELGVPSMLVCRDLRRQRVTRGHSSHDLREISHSIDLELDPVEDAHEQQRRMRRADSQRWRIGIADLFHDVEEHVV